MDRLWCGPALQALTSAFSVADGVLEARLDAKTLR
jgi:hypothetical protein